MKSLPCIFVLAGMVGLASCSEQEKGAAPLSYGDAITGFALPVHLNHGETRIPLGDFFQFPERVDSVHIDVEVAYELLRDSGVVRVFDYEDERMVAAMEVWYEAHSYHIPLFKSRSVDYRFTYEPPRADLREVGLKGNFNGWNHKATLLTRDDDVWTADLVLSPGLYEYLVVEDGVETLDRNHSDRKDNGRGGYNSTFRVGSDAAPVFVSTYGMSADSVVLHYDGELHPPLILWENHRIDQHGYAWRGDRLAIAVPGAAANMERSHLRVFGCSADARTNDVLIPLDGTIPVSDASTLQRTDKQTWSMYFMMVDRFVNGDTTNDFQVPDPDIMPPANYYGGDLAGVEQKIRDGYFDALGVNTIWLSPITQNPLGAYGLWDKGGVRSKFSGYHGYWPISSSQVDFRFGDEQSLQSLIASAHDSDANVILDYVANHVHQEHPVYQQHPEWATELYLPDGSLNTERWDEHRLTTWFDTFMPTLDLENPEVVAAMTDSALFWFEQYPIDGFRHDATKHIPLDFWRELTRKLKYRVVVPEQRNIYQIGETYGNAALINSYVGSGLLDAQFDFNLYDAAVSTFAKSESSFEELDRVLAQSLEAYGYHHLMGHISGNQDRARFISYADGSVDFAEDAKLAGWTRKIEIRDTVGYQRLAMLHALNFTLPGIPVIYYGDEIGMPGGNDPDNRRMMRFGDDLSGGEAHMLEQVTALANLRKGSMALLYGDLEVVHLDKDAYAYYRTYLGETAIVAFNKSAEPVELTLHMPVHIPLRDFKNHFGHGAQRNGQTLQLSLAPYSFEILTPIP